MKNVRTMVAFAAAFLAGISNAGTLWVDASASAGGIGSEASPYQTIQAAVNAAAVDDTIFVKPGVYDAGSTRDTISDGKNLARVLLTKRLRIESTGGAAVTHIVGASDASETTELARNNGLGENSVRCVLALQEANGSVLKGFTVRGGRSRYANNQNIFGSHAGGIASQTDGGLYVVDCVVSNCVATRGGACYRVNLVRTLLTYNKVTNNGGAATRTCSHYACILAHNGDSINGSSRSAISDPRNVVHCSLFGNGNGCIFMEADFAAKVYNTVAVLEGNNMTDCASLVFGSSTTRAQTISHCVVSSIKDATRTVKPVLTDVTNGSATPWLTMASPYSGDFRVVADGLCDQTGDASLSAPDWVPEEFRGLDFYGQPLAVRGKANIGAVAASARVEGGVHMLMGSTTWAVEGYEKNLGYCEKMYVRGKTTSTPLTIRETGTNQVYNWSQQWRSGWSWNRWFDDDGKLLLSMPPSGTVVTNWSNGAAGVVYVNPTIGNDAYDGKSATVSGETTGPVKTLARAVEMAAGASIVRCAEGTYDEGSVTAGEWATRVALYKSVVLRGAGMGKSIIKGHYDETTPAEHGCGPAAVRCVYADNKNATTAVIGFTLQDGCVSGNATGPNPPFIGGAFFAPYFNSRAQLIDCVVTNCAGSRGGVMFGGWAHRTTFVGNNLCAAGSESFRNIIMSACVIRDGNPAKGGFNTICNDSLVIFNTTFAGNGNPYDSSVIHGQLNPNTQIAMNCVVDGDLQGNCSKYAAGNYQSYRSGQNGWTHVTEMKLADLANRDLRPRADSPVVGGGWTGDGTVITNLNQCNNLTTAEWYSMVTSADIDGNPYLYVRGKPVAGAYQRPVAVVTVEATVAGEVAPVGTQMLADGESVTVTANGDARRQFLGFTVNGELVSQSERTFTYTVPAEIHAGPYILKAAYNTDWYVNPTTGDDENDGWTPATAKKTLVSAMEGPVAGDTVHAAAGVYAEGTVSDGANSTTKCRVNVPANVTLLGDDRDGTIIEGKAPSSPNGAGLGADAVRGVYLNNGAVLRNLTVRKGYTNYGENRAECWGAGVLGAHRDQCLVEDCTIHDCTGSRSGAGHYVTFNRCRLIDNYGDSTGSAGRDCHFFNTYIKGCRGNDRSMQDSYWFVNCTYDVDKNSASTVRNLFEGTHAFIINSVFLQPNVKLSKNVDYATNVVFVTGSGISQANVPCKNVTTNTLEEIALDANGRPTLGSCLTDAGTDAYPKGKMVANKPVDATHDCDAGQRVYNGAVDIGAFECDWRPQYAQDLKARGVAVTAVDPQVVEEDGCIKLPSGEMQVAWSVGESGNRRVSAQVTGTGNLAMYVGDAEEPETVWTASAAPVVYKWRPEGDLALRFVYTPGAADDGAAYLVGLEDRRGMSVIVR